MVRNYPNEATDLVLNTVKEYPLYSLDKLAQEVPGLSRHAIQRILEKNNLSRIEQRLHYASGGKSLNIFRPSFAAVDFNKLAGELFRLKKYFREPPEPLRRVAAVFDKVSGRFGRGKVFGGIFLVVVFGYLGIRYGFARSPAIILDQPEAGEVYQGPKVFVGGRVIPSGSRVTINNEPVALNGDGSFTAIISVPSGQSQVKVAAINLGRKSEVVRLVSRQITPEEIQEKENQEASAKMEAADRAAEIEKKVNDLLAAKNANASREGGLRILNNRLEEEAGFTSVVGEVANLGNKEVSWVMVTATFYDRAGGAVDTKYGFATDFSQVIRSGEKADFRTQTTTQPFDRYSLSISWEEGNVAGAATEAATPRSEP